MKTYLRLINYARPLSRFVVPFFIFSLIGVVFGIFQFALVIPLLDVLFGTAASNTSVVVSTEPVFSFSFDYLRDSFYYYFNQIIISNGKFAALQFVAVFIVIATIISNIFRYLGQRIVQDARTYSVLKLREAVFTKITSLHLGYLSNERKGDILSRITTDVQEVENTVANSLDAFFKEPFILIGYFITLFIISVKLTLFTLLVIPISGLIIAAIVKSLKKDAKAGQESLSRLITTIDETVSGMRIIKSFNAVDYIRNVFHKENLFYRRSILRMANKREFAPPFSEITGILVVSGILLYGGNLILRQDSELTASEFILYIGVFSQVLRPAKAISTLLSGIQRGLTSGERVLELIDAKEEVTEKPGALPMKEFSKGITFQQVSFAYKDTAVLQNISFTIPKGKSVALVGPSGGGKSTIADLIPRFYDVTGGRILLDGIDIRDLQLDSLREHMGIVTQESILFNDTIFNNIAFGKHDAKEEDVIQAAKIANAHDFIMQTENGYQTLIGDRGGKLSGGQRQRLSIARAVFKNPPILILDEATSALDTESEKLVQEALANLMKNRTSLIIAHRLSTIQHADEILVIQQGKIVERGTHAELLLNAEGLYKRLNLLQAT
ncbi:ABC transporter ATP-binding protein [Rhodocytophaga aerolata]|uniref:ABC transporter ATP-binding protein n=1 Tax=Rhodocytophaga aerolata TaxID=455078 RepID=A0ABT8R1Z4_9BACT|nr:ABC transporter ATP-binding protein [Rhodocytophaga aerolata]MDO1446118.1 ABC transporter ATP-binding protein [Rhodocytophaga aerolata]